MITETNLLMQLPTTIDCPYCGQPRGARCRSRNGLQPLNHHQARRDAVAGITQADAVHAVAALRADRANAAADARQHLDALRRDPQIREQQQRTGDLWRRILTEVS